MERLDFSPVHKNSVVDFSKIRLDRYNKTTKAINGYVTFFRELNDEVTVNL